MNFRCTKKAQERLRLTPSKLQPVPEAFTITDWHCNVVTLGRRPYFLFVHSLSLYAFYVPVAGNTALDAFGRAFREQLKAALGFERIPVEGGLAKLTDEGPDSICPASDRRILGTMVDHANMSWFVVDDAGGVDDRVLVKILDHINESPMSILDGHSPRYVLRAILTPGGSA